MMPMLHKIVNDIEKKLSKLRKETYENLTHGKEYKSHVIRTDHIHSTILRC